MAEPFLNSDQILNQVYDRDEKLLKTSSTGGGSVTPARSEFPIAAYRTKEGMFKDLYIQTRGILRRVRVIRGFQNEPG